MEMTATARGKVLIRKLLLRRIKRKKIRTWFDLGVFLDKLQQRRISFAQKPKDFQKFPSFSKFLSNGSFAFITYGLGVDGVSTEIGHHIRAFRNIFSHSFNRLIKKIHFSIKICF